MKNFKLILIILTIFAFGGCKKSDNDSDLSLVIANDNFNDGTNGWTVDFVDYPIGKEEAWEIKSSVLSLPSPLDTLKKGYMLSGINHSDDLYMFIKKKVKGLRPNYTFTVKLDIELASNARSNTAGVGGAEGENVYIKAGVTAIEPAKVIDEHGDYRLNLDKDSQSYFGKDIFYIDHIANGTDEAVYKLLNKSGEFRGVSDSNGEAWIIIGTDSAYEYTTKVFYTKIKASVRY
ncbi:hypothetical protein ACFOWA_01075 [Pedobacter lithocola]|uniref:Lipoprotein n=1 Tax=Pedobacter lithocola TaxID=1908239 RepID=A0ABV8P5U3_9SPHI